MSRLNPGLQLLPGAVSISADARSSAFRLRPGERATWIEPNATDQEMREWRRAAASVGLSVDVWIAVKLEWALVCADVADESRIATVVEHARAEAEALRLAPSDELRRWIAFLGRGAQPHADHDLPSVALPGRVVARVAPAMLVKAVIDEANAVLDPDALVVERAASLNGMTMESWAYRALASLH